MLLYGALFLAAGAVLLAITYALVSRSVGGRVAFTDRGVLFAADGTPPPLPLARLGKGQTLFYTVRSGSNPKVAQAQLAVPSGTVGSVTGESLQSVTAAERNQMRKARATIANQRRATLDALLAKSAIALGIMAVVSVGLGWVMAGRALRPVRTMGLRARGISERNLHERLALDGPNDELRELRDTFDGLLGRLESAFESQRRFVANASHELRTPITVERTLVEVALADPGATADSLRATCERVLAASEQEERLIEALLTLARGQRGLQAREEIALEAIAGRVLQGASASDVRIESALSPARTAGDSVLVERLVANLVENALHYNVPSGWMRTSTGLRDGRATLQVTNSGPVNSAGPRGGADRAVPPARRRPQPVPPRRRPRALDRRRDRDRARCRPAGGAARGWRPRRGGPLPRPDLNVASRLTWPPACRLTWPPACRLTWPPACRLTWPPACRLT